MFDRPPAAPRDLVRCEGVAKHYDMGGSVVRALDGVSFSIAAGQYAAIMGPSGSGKTTLLSLIGCLDVPTAGAVFIDGVRVSELPADALAQIRNRKIGFVFQRFHLLSRLSALENAALPLLYAGVSAAERRDRAAAKLEQVGLSYRLDHRPAELSGGQQQRVAIARALVTDAPLLLADEPTGAIDSQTGASLLDLFARLNAAGHTIVLVTHDAEVAAQAGRVLEIRDGRLSADRAPAAAPAPAPAARRAGGGF